MSLDPKILDDLVGGRHADPFAVLGPHTEGRQRLVRSFQPGARGVELVLADGQSLAMDPIHPGGVFQAALPPRRRRYWLRLDYPQGTVECEDPYRFDSSLGEVDRYLLGEGSHRRIHHALGAHVTELEGFSGVRFAVWAPNAARVSVVGDFNGWNGRQHVMRLHPGNGIWEIFLPGVQAGACYKYEILARDGTLQPLKTDPLARFCERPPGNASIVHHSDYQWSDGEWMGRRSMTPDLDQPMSIYEVHLGSWRRDAQGGWLDYRQLAETLVDYLVRMGFTHLELLPVTEHPFDGSWGYQPIGLYAPTSRFGDPDGFRHLVDCCHQAGIGVILDWVPAHFPRDPNGLARFDGTALYEHADPRRGMHRGWGTLVFNYGRNEVINYLIGSALCWLEDYHIDGLRVDAVASMLYLDYDREPDEWTPNEQGGNQNQDAVRFLQRLNAEVHARGGFTCAEESTTWPGVSRPVEAGGLGFTYKWNMGWMNDTLAYMSMDPIHRRHHHDKVTFAPVYAFSENFVLPLSHDEVVHGKRSLIGRMPGDEWQRFANLRAYLGFMYGHPGKKLLFMGAELAQLQEWNHDRALDWGLLDRDAHRQVQALVIDLNGLLRELPALHQVDFESQGFEWICWEDRDQSVLSWIRRDRAGRPLLVVCNLTPVVRDAYRIGVPAAGRYRERLNTDQARYGGSGVVHDTPLTSEVVACHGRPHSLTLRLPPLATLMLQPMDTHD